MWHPQSLSVDYQRLFKLFWHNNFIGLRLNGKHLCYFVLSRFRASKSPSDIWKRLCKSIRNYRFSNRQGSIRISGQNVAVTNIWYLAKSALWQKGSTRLLSFCLTLLVPLMAIDRCWTCTTSDCGIALSWYSYLNPWSQIWISLLSFLLGCVLLRHTDILKIGGFICNNFLSSCLFYFTLRLSFHRLSVKSKCSRRLLIWCHLFCRCCYNAYPCWLWWCSCFRNWLIDNNFVLIRFFISNKCICLFLLRWLCELLVFQRI